VIPPPKLRRIPGYGSCAAKRAAQRQRRHEQGDKAVSIKSAVCTIALAFVSSTAFAQPAPLPPGAVAGLAPVMSVQEIGKILRARGFAPQATPVRNGEAYQVRAIDRYGRQVRLAIDARYGDILMVRPIAMMAPGAYGSRPYGSPPGHYDDEPPTGAIGAYPPPPGVAPPRSAALIPAHPPVPRPKPVAKPAAVVPAPAAPAAAPAASAPARSDPAPAAAAPVQPAAPAAPSDKDSMPPVAPLE
jgi:hypothetical protein